MLQRTISRTVHEAKMLVHRAGFDVSRETFKRCFVPSLHDRGVDAVLDVGANAGQFALALRRAGFAGRIVSVEPLAAAHEHLSLRAADDPAWTVRRAAVAASPGVLTMNLSANSVSSSVLPILDRHVRAAPESAYVATEDVPATTVDDLMAEHDLAPARTLLKVDVQGYELPVLRGAAATLGRIAGVRTELSLVPLYEGQALMPQLVDELLRCGLEMWDLDRGFVEPGTGRLLQIDGLFLRKA